jgi:hypothetical protein
LKLPAGVDAVIARRQGYAATSIFSGFGKIIWRKIIPGTAALKR